ncbi:hypothetical protein QE441_003609 [Chryseobacterium sp. SORGH_AS909]|uniref:Uncharacterized protein n=1 Tax=Chryseobacterium camelliae TaxID=1265445 RepID=A0ABU0THK6_9FLAO|nr:hypothetical protein [Chryseobacterium camelliae]MDQ1100475.1 hypothetical protein [Chryseobacterium sp. SORGH_AS_1048]MDR6087815.1 hypothetical protein [Chryseobacterium sp. SORGH_AS_0909]MDR6132190.1 hypothetical protein [Chryseobacterium sp. SORGH_AS_1175]MDT3409606.1 hypothetical protein [Pseudacidovorax intermedius]
MLQERKSEGAAYRSIKENTKLKLLVPGRESEAFRPGTFLFSAEYRIFITPVRLITVLYSVPLIKPKKYKYGNHCSFSKRKRWTF